MSVTLQLDNYSNVNVKDRTNLIEAVEIGATTIVVRNADEIITGATLQISSPNTDISEQVTVSSKTGNTVTLSSSVNLYHGAGEEVLILIGNSFRIYTAPNTTGLVPSDDQFVLLTNVAMDVDESSTKYIHDDGDSSLWYKSVYFNATTNEITDIANSVAKRGGNVGNYVGVDEVRRAAGFDNNAYISDGYLDTYRQQAQAEVNAALYGSYTIPFASPVNAFIQRITLDLTAGYILLDQYGKGNEDGRQRIADARAMLMRIQSGDLVLLDGAGNPASGGGSSGGGSTATSAGRVSSWPNDSTADTDITEGGGAVIFEIGKIF